MYFTWSQVPSTNIELHPTNPKYKGNEVHLPGFGKWNGPEKVQYKAFISTLSQHGKKTYATTFENCVVNDRAVFYMKPAREEFAD
jgi:hypothetical protein